MRGQADAISNALALLTPFADNTDDVLKVLRAQSRRHARVRARHRRGLRRAQRAQGPAAPADRQLQPGLDGDRQPEPGARRHLPGLPDLPARGRATTARATSFAKDANPLITQLRPAARQISPALIGLDKLSPDLRSLFQGLGPFITAARTGLPATSQVLNNTRPILRRLDPFLRNLTPIFDYLGAYKGEIAAFFGNDAAATQLRSQPINKAVPGPLTESGNLHVLRTLNPMNPEIMAGFPTRLVTNRSNPYTAPGAYDRSSRAAAAGVRQLPVQRRPRCRTRPRRSTPTGPPTWSRASTSSSTGTRTTAAPAPPCVAQAVARAAPSTSAGSPTRGGEYPPAPAPSLSSSREEGGAVRALGRRRHAAAAADAGRDRAARARRRGARAAARAERRHRHAGRPRARTPSRPPSASSRTSATRRSSCWCAATCRRRCSPTTSGGCCGLEGCLSGNVPDTKKGARRPSRPSAARSPTLKPAKVVFGPATFINTAVNRIVDEFGKRQAAAQSQAEQGSQRGARPVAAARRLARRAGASRPGGRAGRQLRSSPST